MTAPSDDPSRLETLWTRVVGAAMVGAVGWLVFLIVAVLVARD